VSEPEQEPEGIEGQAESRRPSHWWLVTTGPGPDGYTYVAPFWARVTWRNIRWRARIWWLGKRGY
jgi:hypothetical protein